jgi:hypothetical protein
VRYEYVADLVLDAQNGDLFRRVGRLPTQCPERELAERRLRGILDRALKLVYPDSWEWERERLPRQRRIFLFS